MRAKCTMTVAAGLGAMALASLPSAGAGGPAQAAGAEERARSAQIPVGPDVFPTFSNPRRIDNPYLPLSKFRRCVLRGRTDDGTRERSVKRLLRETHPFRINGQRVEAAIIQDSAFEDGELAERTRDYFVQSDEGTVYYLGEHVQNLKNGRLVNRKGTWLYGKHTNVLGVVMASSPTLGRQWRAEDVPGVTVESLRVEEVGMRFRTGGRVYRDVIRIQEFIQPEGDVEYKLYARGTGLIAEYPPDGAVFLQGCR